MKRLKQYLKIKSSWNKKIDKDFICNDFIHNIKHAIVKMKLLIFTLILIILIININCLQISVDDYHNKYIKIINETTFKLEFSLRDINYTETPSCFFTQLPYVPWFQTLEKPQLPVFRYAVILYDKDTDYDVETFGMARRFILLDKSPCDSVLQKNRCSNLQKNNKTNIQKNMQQNNKKDRFWPNDYISLKKKTNVRGVNVGILEITPFRYDEAGKIMEVTYHMIIKLVKKINKIDIKQINKKIKLHIDFLNYYQNIFINFDNKMFDVIDDKSKILIVCGNNFIDICNIYMKYKLRFGMFVKIFSIHSTHNSRNVRNLHNNSNKIKNIIKTLYEKWDLTHVILVGDINYVPSLKSSSTDISYSDSLYGMFHKKNSIFMDVFISRVSGISNEHIRRQFSKFMAYDLIQPHIFTFQGIASNESDILTQTDCAYMRNLMKLYTNKKTNKNKNTFIECDPYARKINVLNRINKGYYGGIYYIGSNDKGWKTTKINSSDADNLKNHFKNPFIIDTACYTGDMMLDGGSLAENFMRSNNKQGAGALYVYASSSKTLWLPPITMQYFISSIQIKNEDWSVASNIYSGMSLASIVWYDTLNSNHKYISEGYVLFGDGSRIFKI